MIVTFVVMPEGMSLQKMYSIDESIDAVRLQLEEELNVSAKNIVLNFNSEALRDGSRLTDYAFDPEGSNVVELIILPAGDGPMESQPSSSSLADAANTGPGGSYPGKDMAPATSISETIEVHVQTESSHVILTVLISREELERKVYMGGYKHKTNGRVYHHATCQTIPGPKKSDLEPSVEKYCRETQTKYVASRKQQTIREQSTQMAREDYYDDGKEDYDLAPRPYFDSNQWSKFIEQKTIIIQCYTRGWFARRRAQRLREELETRKQFILEQEAKRQQEVQEKRRKEIDRRMHPRSAEDFDILYAELEAWRASETAKIHAAEMSEDEKQATLAQLLRKETRLLQTIDRLKIVANQENKKKNIHSKLDMMSAPKKWQMSDGAIAEVHTPFTIRSRELMELYNGLNMTSLSIDERLDVLLHVKWTVKEFDCNLTRQIVDLIDREADMLNRGRSEKSLAGLRQRSASLFLQFVETPEFNPEAARFQRVPREFVFRPDLVPLSANDRAPPVRSDA